MNLREAIAKAFKESDLDCAQWKTDALLELADIAVSAAKNHIADQVYYEILSW